MSLFVILNVVRWVIANGLFLSTDVIHVLHLTAELLISVVMCPLLWKLLKTTDRKRVLLENALHVFALVVLSIELSLCLLKGVGAA